MANSLSFPKEILNMSINTNDSFASSNVVDCSEVLNNTPATPNFFSITSSPNEAAVGGNKSPEAENDGEKNADAEKGDENQIRDEITNKQVKEKKNKSPTKKGRFAFKTKSEVDHLDDGYRWRKYGQKAVKNSPYPRSYYRCTADGCGVKKRVERSYEDPSTVVTTYDDNHTHPCPVLSNHRSRLGYRAYGSGRGNATAANSVGFSSSTCLVLEQQRQQFQNLQNNIVQYRAIAASFSSSNSFLQNHNQGGSFVSSTWMSDAPRQGLLPAGNGLLQDIIMSAQMQRGQGIN
ncbi:WRKY domain [Sesbania bispinosa]|nr:WRKY domain [Sesbania bispinosa]